MRGVCWSKNNRRWRASLGGYGRNGYIGEFLTYREAVEARKRAEVELHGRVHEQAELRIVDGVIRLPVMNQRGRVVAISLVDECDLHIVEQGRWCRTRSGYVVQRRDGRVYYLHRLIFLDGEVCDHISGDKLDNRRANLRPCSQKENSRNTRLGKNNRSGFKGVRRASETTWEARIMVDRKGISLGRFTSAELAAEAYAEAARKFHGEFASPTELPDCVKEAA